MRGWNGWYHVDGHTYGTWLPGDPRGWREKRHKKHVEGDYRNPPPDGSGVGLHEHSRSLLKQPPVYLEPAQREVAGRALVEMLVQQGIEVLSVSLDAVHYHILGRFAGGEVRRAVGRAKKHAYYRLRERWEVGKVWQRLCKVTPIADRAHQVRVFGYIRDHGKEGAWTWTFRDGITWQSSPSA